MSTPHAPDPVSAPETSASADEAVSTRSWTFGSAIVTRVTELVRWPFAPTDLFPAITEEAVAEVAAELPNSVDEATGCLELSIHTYLVEVAGRRLLVDPGNGNDKCRPVLLAHDRFSTDYLDRLAGVIGDPATVDLVVSTHLHPDHCGGNTRLVEGRWSPTFANADYLFVESEVEALRELVGTVDPATVRGDFARLYEDSIAPVVETGRSRAIEPDEVLLEGAGTVVRIVAAPGHTAGHVVVEIEAPDGTGAVLSGDVIHHPVQLRHPELSQAGDADPMLAAATRAALLHLVHERDWTLLTAHFAPGGPERLARDVDGSLRWAT